MQKKEDCTMKENTIGKKLSLKKTTVSDLDISKMTEVKGGLSATRTSGDIVGCYCDSIRFCTCPLLCPV
jgi:hypothetical protein